MDIMMPEMDGTRRSAPYARSALRRLPIIADRKAMKAIARNAWRRRLDYLATGQHRAAAIRPADVAASLTGEDHATPDRVNISGHDQKAKLLSYEVILHDLGET